MCKDVCKVGLLYPRLIKCVFFLTRSKTFRAAIGGVRLHAANFGKKDSLTWIVR